MPPVDIDKIKSMGDYRVCKINGHVGFDSLPDQLVTKAVQSGFIFNIICIGETGLGKSTLMDSLFNTSFESTPSSHTLDSVKVKSHTYELHESNVKLKLTLCDTVGYGDQINKEESSKAIVDYIDAQFENYLQEELKIKRSLSTYHDSRIHACLYFICPTGHGLKALDLVCMRKLQKKVNIIPVIAMADTVAKSDLTKFKERITSALAANGIQIYQFPVDDAEVAESNRAMNAAMPFAVVGSTDFVKVGNKMMRAREYPWGTVQVENEAHCDFVKLREMLIRTNMEDLRDSTHSRHYELYRCQRLEQMGFTDVGPDDKPTNIQKTCQLKRAQCMEEMKQKEERMKEDFVQRVKEKEAELRECERLLQQRLKKINDDYTLEKNRLDDETRAMEEDMAGLERRRNNYNSGTGKKRNK